MVQQASKKRNVRKRYWRLENYFHHVSKMIVENCVKLVSVKSSLEKTMDGNKQ